MKIRKVPKTVLFDYQGMNPATAKIFGFKGIADDEILVRDDLNEKETSTTIEHEPKEIDLINSGMCYWDAHIKLLKELEGYKGVNMSNIIRKAIDIVRKDGKIVISTYSPDRGGDRVNPKGGHFENYLKNPIIMWLHDYKGQTPAAGIPIARCPNLSINDTNIISDEPQFLPNDPFAERVKNAWNEGFIKTASIGFAPLSDPVKNEFGGFDYDSWELLEWSLVPIPMNAEAMRIAEAGYEDLIDKPTKKELSQPEIADEIDYIKTIVNTGNLDDKNKKSVEILLKDIERLLGYDKPIEIKIAQKTQEAIQSALDSCAKCETLLDTHHQAHISAYMGCKDLIKCEKDGLNFLLPSPQLPEKDIDIEALDLSYNLLKTKHFGG